jgi:hypothetical protein
MADTFARSTGQGQGSATILSGQANTIDTSSAAKGVDNMFTEYKRDLAGRALKEEAIKKKKAEIYSKIGKNGMVTPAGKAAVSNLYKGVVDIINEGKYENIDEVLLQASEEAAILESQEKSVADLLKKQEEAGNMLPKDGTYSSLTSEFAGRTFDTEGVTPQSFREMMLDLTDVATQGVQPIVFDPEVPKKSIDYTANFLKTKGIEDVEVTQSGDIDIVKTISKLSPADKTDLERNLMGINRGNAADLLLSKLPLNNRNAVFNLTNFEVQNPQTGEVKVYENFEEYNRDFVGVTGSTESTKTLKRAKDSSDGDKDKVPTEGEQSFIESPTEPFMKVAAKNTNIMQKGSNTSKQKVIGI